MYNCTKIHFAMNVFTLRHFLLKSLVKHHPTVPLLITLFVRVKSDNKKFWEHIKLLSFVSTFCRQSSYDPEIFADQEKMHKANSRLFRSRDLYWQLTNTRSVFRTRDLDWPNTDQYFTTHLFFLLLLLIEFLVVNNFMTVVIARFLFLFTVEISINNRGFSGPC